MKDYPVKVDIYTETSLFDTLKPEWNALVERSYANTPFSRWEWHYHWWSAYQPGTLRVMTFRTDEGRLIGIAPWYVEQHPERGCMVRCIGSDDVTDYLDVIVDVDCPDVYACLADTVAQACQDCPKLDLSNIPAASPTYTRFPDFLEQNGMTVALEQQEVCPLIVLPETFDAYLETIVDSKQRGEIRRKLRKADGYNASMGKLSWYIVDKTHNIDEEIERFTTLMALSHPEKAAFLTNSQHVAFFKSIIPAALDEGWLQLCFLMIDGEPAAAYCNFDYNNQILVYNSGLNPRKFSELSPGIVLLAYTIKYAIEQKREVFDFLRGNEQYKYRMGAKNTAVYNLKATLAQ